MHTGKCSVTGAIIGLLVLLMLPATKLFADVTNYDSHKMVYTNKGGYIACVQVHWKTASGDDAKLWWNANKGTFYTGGVVKGECVRVDQQTTVDFTKVNDLKDVDGKTLEEGKEIWLVIDIWGGDKKSCRKDSSKYYYSESGTAKPSYKTKGTTLNDNHCELTSKE